MDIAFIQSDKMCLLIGVFRPLRFDVIIHMNECKCTILLFVLFFLSILCFPFSVYIKYILIIQFYLPTALLAITLSFRFLVAVSGVVVYIFNLSETVLVILRHSAYTISVFQWHTLLLLSHPV